MFSSLLVGLILRIAIAPWTEQRWDSYINRLMGAYIFGYGINPFIPSSSCNCPDVLNYSYPPIWLLLIIPLFGLWLAITDYAFPLSAGTLWAAWGTTGNLFEAYRSFIPPNLPLLDLLLKTPVILSDVAIGYLIWRMGGQSARAANVSRLAWIFNPYVITIGSVWGQFDSIAALFLLLSAYYFLRERFFKSGIMLALGVATKLFPAVILLPSIPYLIFVRRSGLARYLAPFWITLAISFSSALLFPNGFDYIYRLLIGRASPNFGGTLFFSGLTWMLIFNQYPIPIRLPIFPIVLSVTLAFFTFMFRKSLRQRKTLLPFLTVAILAVYLSYPSVNAQYTVWVVPLLAVLLVGNTISKWSIVLLSLIPLSYLLTHFDPLYLISPALIFDENNYLPASDIVKQLWNFPPQLPFILAAAFTITIILTIDDLMVRSGVLKNSIWTVKGSE